MLENNKKFQNPHWTLKKEKRAHVVLKDLKTLWFNTGTQCNLSCENCYIESNPKNDRLAFLKKSDVSAYLDEVSEIGYPTEEIGFTGGEPFLNPEAIALFEESLKRGFKTLVLTNAYRLMNRFKSEIIRLKDTYDTNFVVRVSLDHFSEGIHEKERGHGTFQPTVSAIQWLYKNGVTLAVAGRALESESLHKSREGYAELLKKHNISLDVEDLQQLVIFPEMSEKKDVPEITTQCWGILGKNPSEVMCSSSRMIARRKGEAKAKVLACTLIAYDKQFELGESLKEARSSVSLNHKFCSQFCVLGGASCS